MSYNKYNSNTEKPKQTHRRSVSQTNSRQSASSRDFDEKIDLLCNTDDLDMLVNFFSALAACLLSKKIKYARAVKCDALYNKLALVLKSGVQTKLMVALNFISSLLHQDNKNALTRTKSLNVYAKNMIRISGCLAAMSEMFISFMMHQDTWKVLCRSISEVCEDSYPNQSYCSHLVPMCIQRCRQGNNDIIPVLKSLLLNHQSNVKLFHESDGMSIFNRQYLQNPACLQLLNLVVENTKPENRDDILNASHVFQDLRAYINAYGRNSSIGQWAFIVLFSLRKVMKSEMKMEEEENSFEQKSFETNQFSINDTKVDQLSINDTKIDQFSVNDTKVGNETTELFQNVLKEVIGWQNQASGKRKNEYGDTNDVPRSFQSKLKPRHNAQLQGNVDRSAVAFDIKKGLSFSFLLKHTAIEPRFKKTNNKLRTDRHCVDAGVQASSNESSFRNYTDDAFGRSSSTVLFKPRYTSTPQRISAASTETSCPASRNHSISNKTINHKRYRLNTTLSNRKNLNSSISTFLGILNSSCTTLIKGFKNIFVAKTTSDNTEDKSQDIGVTKLKENKLLFADSIIKGKFNTKNVTKESSLENPTSNFCSTCNDTVILKHKFSNDLFLQETVNRLKLGINLHGCDFKKISRTMWPREPYMTPNVLFNLYRKLIVNKK